MRLYATGTPMPSAKTSSLPVVAHGMQTYLVLSETFIYQVIRHFSTYRPIVLAEKTANTGLFPFEPVYATETIPRFSWWWMVNGLRYRFGDKMEFFEHIGYVRHVLKKTDACIIHAHFGPVGVRMLPLARSLNIPLVTTFYGYDMSELPRQPVWRERYARLFDEGSLFLVEGGHMRQALIALGCPEDRVEIQRIGVDLSLLPFRERQVAPGERVVTLFCGRFTEKKGPIYALEALEIVLSRYPDVELRIIGDGEDRSVVEQYITDHHLEDHTRLLGYQPYSVFREQLEQTHLFIQPSVTASDGDTEGGAPTVLIEAQACGVPVLATRHADIPEVVRDGQSGILVPERDAEALAAAWMDMLNRRDAWPEMGHHGRRHIENQHDITKTVPMLEQRYNRLPP